MRRVLAAVVAVGLLAAAATVPLPVSAHTNDVRVDPQVSADGTVVVETVFIAEDGWLVLHADDNGSLGEPIGHTAVESEGGLKEDLPVRVDEEHWRDWEPARVHAALHRDDGDGEFDPDDDPVLSSFGNPSTDAFSLASGPDALVTARGFGAQQTDDRRLLVRQVRLPADGHLVALNTTEVDSFQYEPVAPVGATALEAGTHRNVTVALNRSFYRSTPEQFRVSFAVYRDDGDGAFDGDDEPVRVTGEMVDTVIAVERTEPAGTATPTATPSGGGDGGSGGSTATDGTARTTPGGGATATAEPGGVVTTATPSQTPDASSDAGDDSDDGGSVVVTASPTPSPTATASPTATPSGGDTTDGGDGGDAPGTTASGGQPGFGAVVGVAALLAALTALVARDRRRRT